MAVTKQTYIASNWTEGSLRNIFRSAFIDAGLMTDWFDVTSTMGILKVDYDTEKTYGSTYYAFYFLGNISGPGSNGGVYMSTATGWNTSTKAFTGTQYLDFVNDRHTLFQAGWPATSTTFILDRYTSTAAPGQSWFVIRSSLTNFRAFTIDSSLRKPQSWLDLDKGIYSGFYHIVGGQSAGGFGTISFKRGPAVRREITAGGGLIGSTTESHYVTTFPNLDALVYAGIGASSSNTNNYTNAIHLPIGLVGANPAYTSNSNPVFYGMPYSPYSSLPLSPEFGISFHYATNSFLQGDTFVVTSGVEEWEILHYTSNSTAVTGASPIFVARVV